MFDPRGFAPRTPLHASLAGTPAPRSVRVARFAALARGMFDPRGFAPRAPRHASLAGTPAPRSVRVARFAALARGMFDPRGFAPRAPRHASLAGIDSVLGKKYRREMRRAGHSGRARAREYRGRPRDLLLLNLAAHVLAHSPDPPGPQHRRDRSQRAPARPRAAVLDDRPGQQRVAGGRARA